MCVCVCVRGRKGEMCVREEERSVCEGGGICVREEGKGGGAWEDVCEG